jgi:hypothetical protein
MHATSTLGDIQTNKHANQNMKKETDSLAFAAAIHAGDQFGRPTLPPGMVVWREKNMLNLGITTSVNEVPCGIGDAN